MNTIFRISVQSIDGLWCYDDVSFEVKGQPFVFGADLILDKMADRIDEVGDQLNLVFSSIPFPGSEFCLDFVREETEGFVYRWEEKNLQGWLSPSLRNYFPEPPPNIYLQLLPIN
ncbi:MAG: hypothetical protein CMO75_08495 [Verrucomicrobiales bacterium]|nr:hypothetical protein [Verrucomicrobiales bacterium]